MKFDTEHFVMKIKAPIVCRFDGKELHFENGEKLASYQFSKRYKVDTVTIEEGNAVIALSEVRVANINSVGDELSSGDNWIAEHKKLYGVEPNLFDGA
ncbi:hypothetical protein SAMN05216356_11663 [Oribacterium sp. WCC10]|nr:hypothetical protein SAMN05216356_11663 [Oribacterium sp. WCC10]